MTFLRRAGVVLSLAGALLAGPASPASAHAGGLVATDVRSEVVSVTPALPGLSVTTIEEGAKLRLTNSTRSRITIPAGGGPATPAAAAAGASVTWPDTRSSPVGVTSATDWSLTLDAAGTPVTVRGVFVPSPRPPYALWWGVTVLLAIAVPVLCRRLPRGDLVLAVSGLAAMAASIAHVAGSTMEVVSAPLLGTFVNAAGINLLAWPLILGGAVASLRGKPAGLLAVCAGAALTAVFVLPDVTSFHRAVLPFAGPAVLERLLVTIALGAGSGTAVAGASVLRTLAAEAQPEPA